MLDHPQYGIEVSYHVLFPTKFDSQCPDDARLVANSRDRQLFQQIPHLNFRKQILLDFRNPSKNLFEQYWKIYKILAIQM